MEIQLQDIRTDFFKLSKFTLSSGQKILIQGPSGSGKTTFLHLLAGLYRPQQGEISWDGASLNEMSENALSKIRYKKMALVFQNLNLLSYLTSQENIELCGVSKNRALECLEQVGLAHKNFVSTPQLSLGEQQRVAVARVLAQQPEVILADEPTSSLDDDNSHQVMSLLMTNKIDQSLIVVSHDHRVAGYFDKIINAKDLFQ